jgi:anthranilate synthase/aminodeoxychorismate synthase-like glutamine amidotransferase
MAKILLLDNYDSFTWNLYQFLEELGAHVDVIRNDQITVDAVAEGPWEAIVVSPGPKTPDDAGITLALIQRFSGVLPLLGVCLGHQAIVQAFGGQVVRAPRPVHGKASVVRHTGAPLWHGIPETCAVGRYHSLVGATDTIPSVLRVTARSLDDDLVMAIEHTSHPTWGVQFHPESILTEHGHAMLANFLRCAGMTPRAVVSRLPVAHVPTVPDPSMASAPTDASPRSRL